jgi:hypothetical protein
MKASYLLAVVVAGLACESVTPSRIEYWKGSAKGPTKLVAALSNPELSPKMRAQAAAALADIGMSDLAETTGAQLPAPQRWEILKTLVPLLCARLPRTNSVESLNARDALFGWRRFATPEDVASIDSALLPALERELREGRPTRGRFGVPHMVQTIGVAAAPMLIGLLRDQGIDSRVPAELLAMVGGQDDREMGGRLLVERVLSGKSMDDHKRDALWAAMGYLSGKSVTAFLSQRLVAGNREEALRAAHALQLAAAPEVVPLALRLAADPATGANMRDELFQVVARAGGPAAEKGLLDMIASHPSDAVRYQACTAALIIGQAAAIEPILDALPARASYRKKELVEHVVQELVLVEPGVRTAVMRALQSRSPVARMVAVLALETTPFARVKTRLGTAADVPALLQLANDSSVVRGFPPGETVGSEALRVSRLLGK